MTQEQTIPLPPWEQARAEIRAVLEDGQRRTVDEIAGAVKRDREETKRELGVLVYLGQVTKVEQDGQIRYALAESQPEEQEEEAVSWLSEAKRLTPRSAPIVRGKRHFAQLRDGDVQPKNADQLLFPFLGRPD
jgi:hypothetical protein